ncbi:MAG: GAF domain-containing protein [Chloroflexi bacterium]|nr:GAF domain-containing protein [Chloroflexota bacterium]
MGKATTPPARGKAGRPPLTAGVNGARPATSEPAGLARVAKAIARAGTPDELSAAFAGAFARDFPCGRILVAVVDPETSKQVVLTDRRAAGRSTTGMADLTELAALAVTKGSTVRKAVPTGPGSPAARFTAFPLKCAGRAIGAVVVEIRPGKAIAASQRVFAKGACGLLAGALAGTVMTESHGRRTLERDVFGAISRIINASQELDDVYEHFAEELKRLLPFDRISVLSVDLAQDTFSIKYVSGVHIPGLEPGEVFRLVGSPDAEAATRREAILVRNSDADGLATAYPRLMDEIEAGMRAFILAPLSSRNEIIGVLRISSVEADAYDDRTVALVERVGALISGSVASAELHRQALRLAEERELRARLDAENRELVRIDQLKRRFFSLVSHELKTPLTTMVAFADVLAANRENNLTPRQLTHLRVMQRNGRRLNLLVEDLFDLARIETGGFKLTRRECEVKRLLEDQVASFAPIVGQKNQTVKAEIPQHEVWMEVDPDRLAQIVSNLLSNASKYSPNDGEIALKAYVEGDRLHVSVSDQGVGIPKKDHRNIFTAFFRADNEETRSVPGTGLGLFITKTLVEMHGGQITLDSDTGKGTTMSFYVRGVMPAPPPNAQPETPAAVVPRFETADTGSS